MSKSDLPTVPWHRAPRPRVTAPLPVTESPIESEALPMDEAGEVAIPSPNAALEDALLGQAESATFSNYSPLPPPEPPRASVDPEPSPNLDPRDFDLPQP